MEPTAKMTASVKLLESIKKAKEEYEEKVDLATAAYNSAVSAHGNAN